MTIVHAFVRDAHIPGVVVLPVTALLLGCMAEGHWPAMLLRIPGYMTYI